MKYMDISLLVLIFLTSMINVEIVKMKITF